MELGVQKFRCQGADALKQAIHSNNGLAWTDGRGIFLSPVSLFRGQVEPQEHYKLGEFERGVRSVHWSDSVGEGLCFLCVVHDKNISLWRVDGAQPRLTFKQVRKVNIQPIPQGCLWSPKRDILGVLCPHQASLYYSHLKNKGSQVLLQLERDKIRCGCWTTDGSKLVICVSTTLMVYSWSDIDQSVTEYASINWTVPGIVADTLIYGTPYANRVEPDETAPTGAVSSGSTLFANMSNHVTMRLLGRISSVVPVSESQIIQASELPLESLCKQPDTFLLPDVVRPSPGGEFLPEPKESEVIRPSGRQSSITQTLLNLPRNPEAVIEDCCRLDYVQLREDQDPVALAGCQVKGLLSPDILLYEPDLATVVVGSNTQSLLQVYSVDTDQISKTTEILLDKSERPKGIACLPRVAASSTNQQGVLLLVGKTTPADSTFPSATNEISMKSVLKFFSVKQGGNGKAPLTHTNSAPSIPLSVAANGHINEKEHEKLTYSVINFDTNLHSAQSVGNIQQNGVSHIKENRSVSEVNVSVSAPKVKSEAHTGILKSRTESFADKKVSSVLEPPKRPVRKKKSLRGKDDLSRNSSNSSGSQNEQPKKMAMEYLSDSSETSPRECLLQKQDSLGSVSSTQSVHGAETISVIKEVDSSIEKETVQKVELRKSVLQEVDINQNTAKTESNYSHSDSQGKNGEITAETLKLPNQSGFSTTQTIIKVNENNLPGGELQRESSSSLVQEVMKEIYQNNLTNGESQNKSSSSTVRQIEEIGQSNLTNGELEVERTEFSSQKQDFKPVDLGNLFAEDAESRRVMEDVISKKLGTRLAQTTTQSVSLESLDDIDRILQAQNLKISQLQEQMNSLSRRVDESCCVLPTRYQAMSKAAVVHLCFRCKDGTEIKKKFLLDNGRLQFEEVKHAFSLATLEIQIDGDWCVTGCNIDGYIPVRFETGSTVYISGSPALS